MVGPAEGMASVDAHGSRAGQGPFVIEADEYDRMFLGLRLETAVVTNVEWDHVDCYPTPSAFAAAFRQYVTQLPAGGLLSSAPMAPGHAGARRCPTPHGAEIREAPACRLRPIGRRWRCAPTSTRWDRREESGWMIARVATLSLAVPGRHNVATPWLRWRWRTGTA